MPVMIFWQTVYLSFYKALPYGRYLGLLRAGMQHTVHKAAPVVQVRLKLNFYKSEKQNELQMRLNSKYTPILA